MNMKEKEIAVGGLSNPFKMPWFAYNIPAKACLIGSYLVGVLNSVCSVCYALGGRYMFPVVIAAMERRLALIGEPEWADNMVRVLTAKAKKTTKLKRYFRWHDSGDLQGLWHLRAIGHIAYETAGLISYWIPTKELKQVRDYEKQYGQLPDNLCVRVSGMMVDRAAPKCDYPTSMVISRDGVEILHYYYPPKVEEILNELCPASMVGLLNNKKHPVSVDTRTMLTDAIHRSGHESQGEAACGSCRRCWNREVKNVIYIQH
jgi:hypothetical protein